MAVILRTPSAVSLPTQLELADRAFDVLLETGVYVQPRGISACAWNAD